LPRDAAVLTQPGAAFIDLVLELLPFRIDPRADLLFFRIRIADGSRDGVRTRLGIFDRRVPGIAGGLGGVLCGGRNAVPGCFDESTNVVEQSHRGLPIMPTLGASGLHAEKTGAVQ